MQVSFALDDETMKTHYTKHYKGYVEKLNLELEKAIHIEDYDKAALIRDELKNRA